jgi:hypothetical protein
MASKNNKVKMYVAPAKTTANEAKSAGDMAEYYKLKLSACDPKGKNYRFFSRHLARIQKEVSNG